MRNALFAMAVLPLAACSSGWEPPYPESPPGGTGVKAGGVLDEGPAAVSSVSQLPAKNARGVIPPYGAQGTAAAYEYFSGYRVGAGDRLTVRVAGEADLTAEYLVDGSGNISLPYVQTINIAGLTAVEIERAIGQRLRRGFLKNPQVSVQVTTLRPFYILGEVETAGSFSYQPGMTVQNAVAIAGGYGARADRGNVMITRKNATGTLTYKVPVTTQIYPGDIVYVRERWF